jgi:SAM-dependent methyltransferase
MGQVKGVNIVVGIPSFGMVSTHFLQARVAQQFPLVSSTIDKIVVNKPIADARNEIVEFALSTGANYIYWLDDDVIAPPDTFLKMYYKNKDIVNGVYWSKSNPPVPLMFRGHLDGSYWDWHVGDFIEIDAAGSGLTLVKTDVYRRMAKELGGPWYSVDYASFPGATKGGPNNTEDLYFYWKAKKLGYKVWCDTSIQAMHYDKVNNMMSYMPFNAPQAIPAWAVLPEGDKLIADLGSGEISPYMRDEGKVVRFDIREDVKPDVICDVRSLPVPDETFDIVHAAHVLEHFPFKDTAKVLKEWTRVLKVGGELRLAVPDLRHVGHRLITDRVLMSDLWIIYGEQDYAKNYHASGFTPGLLRAVVESLGAYDKIEIAEIDVFGNPNPVNWTLQLKAIKSKNIEIQENITPEDVEAPDVPLNYMWPMVQHHEWKDRPMTPEEIQADIEKAALNKQPPKFNIFGSPEERMWVPQDEEKVEVKDGLDSDNQGQGSNKRKRSRKTSTSG